MAIKRKVIKIFWVFGAPAIMVGLAIYEIVIMGIDKAFPFALAAALLGGSWAWFQNITEESS